MSILVNTHNEQEEKILLAFLDSLKFDYKSSFQDQDDAIQSEFLKQYNSELDEAVKSIEQGNFVLQADVEKLLAERRKALK
jgi:hypothetical protein